MTGREFSTTLRMAKSPTAPAQARALVGKYGPSWMDDMALSDALLVVSEVVSSAAKYGPGDTIELTIRISEDVLWVGVTQAQEPTGTMSERDQHSLTLIDVLSSRWGAFESNGESLVWFELVRPPGGSTQT